MRPILYKVYGEAEPKNKIKTGYVILYKSSIQDLKCFLLYYQRIDWKN